MLQIGSRHAFRWLLRVTRMLTLNLPCVCWGNVMALQDIFMLCMPRQHSGDSGKEFGMSCVSGHMCRSSTCCWGAC